jgi:hypothetical protein
MLGSCSLAPVAATTQSRAIADKGMVQPFDVKAFPNPSANNFTLYLQGSVTKTIQLRVTDIQGRLIENKQNLQPNQTIRFGDAYRPGIYMVEIIQGARRKHQKLIKTSN